MTRHGAATDRKAREFRGSSRALLLFVLVSTLSIANASNARAASGDLDPSSVSLCFGRPATIIGTRGADRIVGTPKHDVIVGLDGNDRIKGGGGNDLICGGLGRDSIMEDDGASKLSGGPDRDFIGSAGGNDLIRGGSGKDRVGSGEGDDVVFGGSENDQIRSFGGDDTLRGGAGRDYIQDGDDTFDYQYPGSNLLVGGPGNDGLDVMNESGLNVLLGGRGNDVLDGSHATDVLRGGSGGDHLAGGGDSDVLIGGLGLDFVDYSTNFTDVGPRSVNVNLSTGRARGEGHDYLIDIEGAIGTEGDDVLIGDDDDNVFFGMRGNDAFDGNGGRDRVSFLYESGVAVTLDLTAGTASGESSATLTDIEDVEGTGGADTLLGDDGPNHLIGLGGDDVISGRGGDDVLDGSSGNDTGDGGPQAAGDECISIENPTSCEITG